MFLSFGAFLFWLVYRKQDAEALWAVFKDVNFFWLVMCVLVMLLSHISRSVRWVMLIEPLGKKVSFWNATLSVFMGYFANMALPRMGEVTRCAVLGKYEKLSVSKLLGTVMVERAIDLIMFLFCLLLAIALQFNVFMELADRYLAHTKTGETSYLWLYILIGLGLVVISIRYLFRTAIEQSSFYKKLKKLFSELAEGFRAVRNLKSLRWFVLHTVFIWLCYYLMMFFALKIFGFSEHLSAIVALSIFVLGSLGMVLPSPGGIGSFHFFVIMGLILYLPQVADIKEKAAAFALLVHGIQTLFIMILGIISLILLPLINLKKNHKK